MAQRIQRRRVAGWRMPAGAIYVGRGSIWGNPFEVGRDGDAAEVVRRYRVYLETKMRMDGGTDWNERFARLRGRDLACWCAVCHNGHYNPCHADVLISIANGIPLETVIHDNSERCNG